MTTSRQVALREGFRSGFEQKAATQLLAAGIDPAYETTVIRYTVPERGARYTADFRLPNGIVVETKGLWDTADRGKHKLLKAQHPDIDIRLLFQNPNNRISKKSATTYAVYCQTHGLRFAKAVSREAPIPLAWIAEPPNEASLEALRKLSS